MTQPRFTSLAALICAATYLFGFALLLTIMAPLGFGTGNIDAMAVVNFIGESTGTMILWNTVIYIINALALIVLVVGLAHRLDPVAPHLSAVGRSIGLIWAGLVLAAGMLANVTVEQVLTLMQTDPVAASETWQILHAVELGLGGGNEIAGGTWLLCVNLAAWRAQVFAKGIAGLGIICGVSGLITIFPALGEVPGAIFGLGAIVWFLLMAWVLRR